MKQTRLNHSGPFIPVWQECRLPPSNIPTTFSRISKTARQQRSWSTPTHYIAKKHARPR